MTLYKGNIRVLLAVVVVCLLASFVQTGAASPHRQTSKLLYSIPFQVPIRDIQWSPDGARLAVFFEGQNGKLYDSWTGELITGLDGEYPATINSIWTLDSQRLIVEADESIKILSAVDGSNLAEFPLADGRGVPDSRATAWSPTGDWVLLYSLSKNDFEAETSTDSFDFLNTTTGEIQSAFQWVNQRGYGVSWNPDGRWLVSVVVPQPLVTSDFSGDSGGSYIWAYDLENGGQALELYSTTRRYALEYLYDDNIQWSPDGTQLMLTQVDGSVLVFELPDPNPIYHLQPDYWVEYAGWSPDGQQILTFRHRNRTIELWDAKTGTQTQVLRGDVFFNSAQWTADGTHILTAAQSTTTDIDKELALWDVASGELVSKMGFDGWIGSFTLNPARNIVFGTRTISESQHNVEIWNLDTWAQTSVMGSYLTIYDAMWSPDGTRLLLDVSQCAGTPTRCARVLKMWEVYK